MQQQDYHVPITWIQVGERKRPAKDIDDLKRSIKELGLLNPITVSSSGLLIAGYHRLTACKDLGWDSIPAHVVNLTELQAELAEIDENIVRKQLTQFDESVQLKRRKEIYEAMYPETKHGNQANRGNRHTGNAILESGNNCHSLELSQQPQSFTENTAQQTGMSSRTVRLKTLIGKALEPLKDIITGSPIEDNQKELEALVKIADPKKGEGIDVARSVLELLIRDNLKTVGAAYVMYKKMRAEEMQVLEQVSADEPKAITFHVEQGQVWKCGQHYVICDDAYNYTAQKVDAVITDPPYGIDYKPDWNKWNGLESDYVPVIGDDQDFDPAPFLNFPTVFLFGANYFSNRLPIGGWLCWDKRGKAELDSMLGSPFELGWYRSAKTSKKAIMIRVQHGGVVNADSTTGNNSKRHHPTQKPVSVMQQILIELTEIGNTILDPFSGSGSTLLACEKTGRKCIAVEMDPNYVRVILERFYNETGIMPCQESFV